MTAPAPSVSVRVHFETRRSGRKAIRVGPAPETPPPGRVPRVTRLMALAIRFDHLIRTGEVRDMAELARLGMVTRARVSQIMNLLLLAPAIQDALLYLEPVESGRDPITERDLRPIAAVADWRKQRLKWVTATHADGQRISRRTILPRRCDRASRAKH